MRDFIKFNFLYIKIYKKLNNLSTNQAIILFIINKLSLNESIKNMDS